MSWELASFLIVGLVVIGGFAWYERSRPPAQIVALVAALAALAIAGRVAFAAFPNVKPTTDVVVFAGYALGGAPGFAVGALTALVSNFWFGQGPWTPWQMAAWGLCGVLGAALALSGRRPNRFILAAICGFAGIFYGALMNFSLMATYGGDLSWARFAVLEVRAIPFDAAHALANALLALVAGPAMLRMLVRFRERFEWTRRDSSRPPAAPGEHGLGPALRGGGLAALLLAVLALGAAAPAAHAYGPDSAADWLASVQNEDGGWGSSPGDASSPTMTCWTMLGLEAAGRNPLDVAIAGQTPVDYLTSKAGSIKAPGTLALSILALEGAGVDPRGLGGKNLVAALVKRRRGDGSFEGWPGVTSYAVLALHAAGADGAATSSTAWLREVQNGDGGWGDTPGSPSTADGTGAAMMALAGSKAAQRGIGYLKSHQGGNGGFALGAGGSVNTMSTAWAVQGALAAGGNPGGIKRGGSSPLDYLAANQAPDGHYRYAAPGDGSKLVSEQTPVWSTAQVLAAITETTYPIAAVARAPQPSPSPPPTSSSPPSDAGGGIPPSTFAPEAEVEPGPELGGTLPESSSGGLPDIPGSTGVAPGKKVPGGGKAPGGAGGPSAGGGGSPKPGTTVPLPESEEPEGATGAEPEQATDGSSGDDSSSGVAGAILAGLLAGCLLFGAAWLARRGWSRWRYGV